MRAVQVEAALADLAAGQWGLFTAQQAQLAGVSRVRLARLTQAGVLVRLVHGVYVLRGAGSGEHLELRAAWLGLDPTRFAHERIGNGPAGAVVSHSSAANLSGYGDLDADRHEFTTHVRKQTRRPDLRLHRGTLKEAEITLVQGLPVTTAERTVVDLLAAGHDGEHVAGVLAGAVRARAIDLAPLAARLAPYAGRAGFPARDGRSLLEHLLELGGVSDQLTAEELVGAARANNTSVTGWLNAALLSPVAEQIAVFTRSPEFVAAMQALNARAIDQVADAAAAPNARIAEQIAVFTRSPEFVAAMQPLNVQAIEQAKAATSPQTPNLRLAQLFAEALRTPSSGHPGDQQ